MTLRNRRIAEHQGAADTNPVQLTRQRGKRIGTAERPQCWGGMPKSSAPSWVRTTGTGRRFLELGGALGSFRCLICNLRASLRD